MTRTKISKQKAAAEEAFDEIADAIERNLAREKSLWQKALTVKNGKCMVVDSTISENISSRPLPCRII